MISLMQRILGYAATTITLNLTNPIQKWRLTDSGTYETEFFGNNKGGMATHQVRLSYHPDNVNSVQPLTEEQRECMSHKESAKGPLKEGDFDTNMMILKSDWGELLPVFLAFFNRGQFVYGGKHGPGLGDVRSLQSDYYTAEQFMVALKNYFELKTFEDFRQFFTRSDLPETHVNALEAILK